MIVKINPSYLSGTVLLPPSKSAMQRACALALISGGVSVISNPGKSNDDLAALDIITKLGISVTSLENKLLIKSNGFLLNDQSDGMPTTLNCGESGLALRMFSPIAALLSSEIILDGKGSLLKRPMHFFDEIFPQLQVECKSNSGLLPIKIKGPLQPAHIKIDGSLSSQFLTGLLIAYAKACTEHVSIIVHNLKSKPYIDLTLQMLKHFGWLVNHENYKVFHFTPNTVSPKQTINYTVEGDWSGAAFILVAGAISGDIILEG
nr:3-phosphoshikimate 1-carboxyvinyltransferase [Chitinophagaceae bacterium]